MMAIGSSTSSMLSPCHGDSSSRSSNASASRSNSPTGALQLVPLLQQQQSLQQLLHQQQQQWVAADTTTLHPLNCSVQHEPQQQSHMFFPRPQFQMDETDNDVENNDDYRYYHHADNNNNNHDVHWTTDPLDGSCVVVEQHHQQPHSCQTPAQILQALRAVSPSDTPTVRCSGTMNDRHISCHNNNHSDSSFFEQMAPLNLQSCAVIPHPSPMDVVLDATSSCASAAAMMMDQLLDHSCRSLSSSSSSWSVHPDTASDHKTTTGSRSSSNPRSLFLWRNNATFAQLVESHAPGFAVASLSAQAVIVQAMASCIQQNNGRFLEARGNTFVEVVGQPMLLGVAKALWEHIQQEQQPPSKALRGAATASNSTNSNSSSPILDSQYNLVPGSCSASLFREDVSALPPQKHHQRTTHSDYPPSAPAGCFQAKKLLSSLNPSDSWSLVESSGDDASPTSTTTTTTMDGAVSNAGAGSRPARPFVYQARKLPTQSSRCNSVTADTTTAENNSTHIGGSSSSGPSTKDENPKVVPKKKAKSVQKRSPSSSLHVLQKKKCPNNKVHNSDGTFAHKMRPSSSNVVGDQLQGNSSSKSPQEQQSTSTPTSSRSKENKASPSSYLSKHKAAAVTFDPRTWLSQHGTLESMLAKAQVILPTLSAVKVIPRGVTVRPSGKWQAQFYFEGQSRYIGVFHSSREAALSYECVHRLLAGFRELSRRHKPILSFSSSLCRLPSSNQTVVGTELSKEEIRTLFDCARKAAVQSVARQERPE